MAQMNTASFTSTAPPPWFPALPLFPRLSSIFWETSNVQDRLKELNDTIHLAKAMQKELEMLSVLKERGFTDAVDNASYYTSTSELSKFLEDNKIDLASQEALSLAAANDLMSKLRVEVEPFKVITDDTSQWEEKSAAVRLANKIQKNKRNKLWRKRKRKRVAEMLAKEHERFDQADQEADEWRAQEIAKDIAKRKVEKMKEIAKIKAKEERKKLESEFELVLTVEKLQELRSIRIQKLKKQGHFLPEEDDKFLERVRAAVEEEERQAKAAADAGTAKDAIATAEEARKIIQSHGSISEDLSSGKGGDKESRDQIIESENRGRLDAVADKESGNQGSEGPGAGRACDSLASLPLEFYHYYHGINTDMRTLIEDGSQSIMLLWSNLSILEAAEILLCKWVGSSPNEILRREPYLVVSLLFLCLIGFIYIFPKVLLHLKALWVSYGPHLNLKIFGETSQILGRVVRVLQMIDLKRIWTKLKL